MKFDDDFVERVRNTADIVDVVADYVHLKKSGQNQIALCPFHSEKTPSFNVSPSKQIFKCFGCGLGGDAFSFVMEIEKLSFPEAIRYLAERHGIPLPHQDPGRAVRESERDRLLEAMEHAQIFFRQQLISDQPNPAKDYLDLRGLDEQTSASFGIGYAPASNQLFDELRKKNFTLDELEACGLIKQDGPRTYDRFRDRIIFPICDLRSRPIAFGGRILGDGVPKYLNSPETSIYHKGSHLYGLNITRDAIRRMGYAILVEGYFDCIVPFQFGFRNVVASLGTSLTERQVSLLGRYTRKVMVNYDPDTAGKSATLRSIDLLLEQGFQINVIQLPDGLDPDTYLLKQGREGYCEQMKRSLPYLDFVLGHAIAEHSAPESPRGKKEIVSSVLPFLAKVPNRIERAEYVSRVAERLKISEELLLIELRRVARGGRPDSSVSSLGNLSQLRPAERILLEGVIADWDREDLVGRLDADLFQGLVSAPIFEKILSEKKRNPAISIFNVKDQLDPADADLLERVMMKMSPEPKSTETIRKTLQALRERRDEQRIESITDEIARAEMVGDLETVARLMAEKERLRKARLHQQR